ncbi:hypothetical protein [Microbacterium saperdae]|uniref:Uncharacterized protein n=1 Tax=Microbacterium saperdae TaxID=69368 RepID=A0A543BQS9_9MICO|nr:hypothetical protein [Microbacterium saperdae]TQL87186.1 hypothetical protein FB560_2853 [Microbacterium saperdae]
MTADWWMVWITVVSVVVTGFLAWLAYANGRKATTIATEAAHREELHREREVAQKEQEERAQVAMAMMRAVSAAEQFAERNNTHPETWGDVDSEMVRTRAEALAQVELYATTEEDSELRQWIESALDAISSPSMNYLSQLEAMDYRFFARRAIRLWNAQEVTSTLIIAGKLPPEITHYAEDEAPESSA